LSESKNSVRDGALIFCCSGPDKEFFLEMSSTTKYLGNCGGIHVRLLDLRSNNAAEDVKPSVLGSLSTDLVTRDVQDLKVWKCSPKSI
jgi:hypothetical protein